ncbi:uncharacterized protein K452DRAFT_136311 [Aplosporella prunicola CBS 121167]|uniref:Uncharacterized protein n=1 Tax=Aplosporella prunicola CBS 121167 TaxID=1176127 RepID=A0A6A6BPK1_9PEZI|nr:uncharacterized protein K452DRAFT_136311 [Aplosporella prunicola CBS 121167]KAF2145205.1 hypothetical protein K452DRAFT_136311 [Aplosporella prunicola CBS 121167]
MSSAMRSPAALTAGRKCFAYPLFLFVWGFLKSGFGSFTRITRLPTCRPSSSETMNVQVPVIVFDILHWCTCYLLAWLSHESSQILEVHPRVFYVDQNTMEPIPCLLGRQVRPVNGLIGKAFKYYE